MARSHRPWISIAAALVCTLACARNPLTGRPEVALISTQREIELGTQAAQELEHSIGLAAGPELAEYVAAIGARLAERSPRRDVEYRFAVVDLAEPNAFALPGGFVYVSRGLLAIANSEDELANVLGHELTHVAARHAVQRETRALPLGILAGLGSLVGGIVGGEPLARAVGALPQAAGGLLLAKYSRDQEREADRFGQTFAAQAGWDPARMPSFFETLEAYEALESQGRAAGPGFFDSHPSTPERVESARARAAALPRGGDPPLAPTRQDFLAHLDGLRVGPDPAQGVFQGELFLHPDFDFALRFPAGWRTQNAPSAVGALAREEDALLVLQVEGRGDDPERAAVEFARSHDLTLTDLERFSVDGMRAARGQAGVHTEQGTFIADLTFFAHRGVVFRLAGAAPVARYEARAEAFRDAARSFRGMTREERAGMRVRRLRVARARDGESVEAFARRAGSAWSPQEILVANAIAPGRTLVEGELLKIAVDEPYVSPPPEHR